MLRMQTERRRSNATVQWKKNIEFSIETCTAHSHRPNGNKNKLVFSHVIYATTMYFSSFACYSKTVLLLWLYDGKQPDTDTDANANAWTVYITKQSETRVHSTVWWTRCWSWILGKKIPTCLHVSLVLCVLCIQLVCFILFSNSFHNLFFFLFFCPSYSPAYSIWPDLLFSFSVYDSILPFPIVLQINNIQHNIWHFVAHKRHPWNNEIYRTLCHFVPSSFSVCMCVCCCCWFCLSSTSSLSHTILQWI